MVDVRWYAQMVCSDGLYNEGNDMVPIKNAGHIAPAPRVLPEISSEDERTIVRGLMRASQLTIAPLIERDSDIYTVADLKVRFR